MHLLEQVWRAETTWFAGKTSEKSVPRRVRETAKLKTDSGQMFDRRWRRLQATKLSDSKMKVVALRLSFPTVRRTQAGVACAGGEMRRKMVSASRNKTGRFSTRFVFSFSILPRISLLCGDPAS